MRFTVYVQVTSGSNLGNMQIASASKDKPTPFTNPALKIGARIVEIEFELPDDFMSTYKLTAIQPIDVSGTVAKLKANEKDLSK